MTFFSDLDMRSIILNIVGGIIVSLLTGLIIFIRHRFQSYHLQRLIGFQFKPRTVARIVYGELLTPLLHDQSGRQVTHPYVKAPRKGGVTPPIGTFSMAHPVSKSEVRASGYVASLLGHPGTLEPLSVSDNDVNSLLDSNFISFGGPGSNYKTADILASSANIFIEMSWSIFKLLPNKVFPFESTTDSDYGFILRITPPEFPTRSWIICAGLGEWGTSGAAWFLSRKWMQLARQIHRWAYYSGFMKIPDFLALVKVIPGQDESAQIVGLLRKSGGQLKEIIAPH